MLGHDLQGGFVQRPLFTPKLPVALPARHLRALNEFRATLLRELGENMHMLALHGSAAHGNFDARHSDLNVLIVLGVATPDAHAIIGDAVAHSLVRIEPIVLGLAEFPRSARAFAVRFAGIRHCHRVLHGVDVLADLDIDPDISRFLVEQGLRSARLRSVHAFMRSRRERAAYAPFVVGLLPELITELSEAMRLNGVVVPESWEARLPLISVEFGCDAAVLAELLTLRGKPRRLSLADTEQTHRALLALLDACVARVSVTNLETPW